MKPKRRRGLACLLLILACTAGPVSPVRAFSTAREVADSKKIDREIVAEQGSVTDPLLKAWVNRIGTRLWRHVHRTDVPYSVKILDSSEVNAFTTGGGFIYLDEGVLDVVGSDDELAGVIGHETGHDEHRHPITLRQRGEVLSLVFGLASLFSPALAALGSFAGEGMMAKASRTDEYQADAEGYNLVLRAGYDPEAMISLMHRLQSLEGDADAHIDRYLADHPGLPERIERLRGRSELQQRAHSDELLRLAALHDESEARYAVAQARFARLLAHRPADPQTALHAGILDIAIGQPARAAQTLQTALESAHDTPTRRSALAHLEQLHRDERIRSNFLQPDLVPLRAQAVAVRAETTAQARRCEAMLDRARTTLASVGSRLQRLQAAAPQFDDQNAGGAVGDRITALGRAVSLITNHAATVIDGVGTLVPGKETGLWADAAELHREVAALVADDQVPAEDRALLPQYSEMTSSLRATSTDLASAVSETYDALLRLDHGLDALEALFRDVDRQQREGGSLNVKGALKSSLDSTQLALQPAVQAINEASQRYNRARSRQLALRLVLLNLAAYPDRRASLAYALDERLAPEQPAAAVTGWSDASAGEYAAARILGADAGIVPQTLLAKARLAHGSVLDLPEVAGVDTETLEIFLGLIYLDYTDDVAKYDD